MTQLQLTLLGAFDLAAGDGHAVRIDMRKARALLAILVMARGQPMRREQIAGLLWSRGETRQALASLSQALYSLRRVLEDTAPDVIAAGTDTVAIDSGQLSVDVWELEAAAAMDSADGRRRCLHLYGGGFLDDLSIDTEEGFSEWRAAERSRIEGLVTAAGTALMTGWETAPETADKTAVDRLLSIDPYNEPAVRVRMMAIPAARVSTTDPPYIRECHHGPRLCAEPDRNLVDRPAAPLYPECKGARRRSGGEDRCQYGEIRLDRALHGRR